MDNLNFKTHFVGKDGFIWWIGQIPDEKVWETEKQKTKKINTT